MKNILMIILAPLVFTVMVKAQGAKAIYAELGGPGVISLNFDTRFGKQNDGIGGRIGVGGFSTDIQSALYVPLGINYLVGKDGKHYFELGAGVTIVDFKNKDNFYYDDRSIFEHSFGHLSIGYRRQPANGGFLFRAAIVPIFGSGQFIPYYVGVAFGYKF